MTDMVLAVTTLATKHNLFIETCIYHVVFHEIWNSLCTHIQTKAINDLIVNRKLARPRCMPQEVIRYIALSYTVVLSI